MHAKTTCRKGTKKDLGFENLKIYRHFLIDFLANCYVFDVDNSSLTVLYSKKLHAAFLKYKKNVEKLLKCGAN